jgi:DivIVA domain-containing protein
MSLPRPCENVVVTGDDVRSVRFPVVVRGYDRAEVDRFIDRRAVELDNRHSPDWLFSDVSFQVTVRAYDRSDVDAFLDQLRTEVESGSDREAAEPEPLPSVTEGGLGRRRR